MLVQQQANTAALGSAPPNAAAARKKMTDEEWQAEQIRLGQGYDASAEWKGTWDERKCDAIDDEYHGSNGWTMKNAIRQGSMRNPKDSNPAHPNYRGKPASTSHTAGNHVY